MLHSNPSWEAAVHSALGPVPSGLRALRCLCVWSMRGTAVPLFSSEGDAL